MVEGQSIDLVPRCLWNNELPSGGCDSILLKVVDDFDTILSHQECSLGYVTVWRDHGIVVKLLHNLHNLIRLSLIGRGFKLFHWPLISHMAIVEEVTTVFKLFNHICGRQLPLSQTIHPSTTHEHHTMSHIDISITQYTQELTH